MAKQYTTVANVEDYLLTTIETGYESTVTAWIGGVSGTIEQLTNREFSEDASASARLFDGNGRTELLIDEAMTVTGLEIGDYYGENFRDETDFITVAPPTGSPIRKLVLKSGVFVEGHQNVRVMATWGSYAETPKDIELAATILVAGIITNQTKGKQAVKTEKIGNYSVSYTEEKGIADYEKAREIIESHKRHIL